MKKRSNMLKYISESLIIAIDIGSKVHFVYWCDLKGTEGRIESFCNTRKGFEKLWQIITAAKEKTGLSKVLVGYESTGPYWIPLVNFLSEKPVKLVQVNPMHTKKAKEIEDNSPLKSDKKDPRVIAMLMKWGYVLDVIIPRGVVANLRNLSGARERACGDRTVALNRLHQVVFCFFPEFEMVIKISSATGRYLLQHYPTAQSLLHLGVEKLTATIEKVSRKQLGGDHARKLLDAAAHTVGVHEGVPALLMEVNDLLMTIARKNTFISHVETQMSACLNAIPDSQILLSIKGVGIVTAAGVLGEVVDFHAYPTQAAILKMAGLGLYEVTSGKHLGFIHITRRGRSLLRKYLYCACTGMVKRNGIFYETYRQLLDRGKTKSKARVILMRKLLRIMFALVRNGVTYNHERAFGKAA